MISKEKNMDLFVNALIFTLKIAHKTANTYLFNSFMHVVNNSFIHSVNNSSIYIVNNSFKYVICH